MARSKKAKSFDAYAKLRRSINAKIARAEKSGTLPIGGVPRLPALSKNASGYEAYQAVQRAQKYGETVQRGIERGRSVKRQKTIERQKENRRIRAVLDSFKKAIESIPDPDRPLSKNEKPGRVRIQAWFEAVSKTYFAEDVARAIEKTYAEGKKITDGLRYEGQTEKNAFAFIGRLNANLGMSELGNNDFINELEEYAEGLQDADSGNDYLF